MTQLPVHFHLSRFALSHILNVVFSILIDKITISANDSKGMVMMEQEDTGDKKVSLKVKYDDWDSGTASSVNIWNATDCTAEAINTAQSDITNKVDLHFSSERKNTFHIRRQKSLLCRSSLCHQLHYG